MENTLIRPTIYKITSPNSKVYIGQTWNYIRRFKDYKNLKCKSQSKLYCSFISHGVDNHTFEIIIELPIGVEQVVLDSYENLYWNFYKDLGIEMLNLRIPDGSRGKHSEESKIKMRESQKHKIVSEETKEKIRISKTGLKASEETKERMSKAKIGTKRNKYNYKKGVPSFKSKYNEEQIKEVKKLIKEGLKSKEISDKLNVNYYTVKKIKENKIWKTV